MTACRKGNLKASHKDQGPAPAVATVAHDLTLAVGSPEIEAGRAVPVAASVVLDGAPDATPQDVAADPRLDVTASGTCKVEHPEDRFVVTGVAVGTCTLTGTFEGLTATLDVSVIDPVKSVTVKLDDAEIPVGLSTRMFATAITSTGSTLDVTAKTTFSTANGHAKIETDGDKILARGVTAGDEVVKAEYAGIVGTAPLKVNVQQPVKLAVLSPQGALNGGITYPFQAMATFTDDSVSDVTKDAEWSIAPTATGLISSGASLGGQATFSSSGKMTVVAKFEGLEASADVFVLGSTLLSLSIKAKADKVAAGFSLPLRAVALYSAGETLDVTGNANWTSSLPAVANFADADSPGRLKGLTAGTTTIQASFGGQVANTSIDVTSATLVKVDVTPSSTQLHVGEAVTTVAQGIFSDATLNDVTQAANWTSSVGAVATVATGSSDAGTVTGVAAGSSVITATASGKSGTSNTTVTAPTLTTLVFSQAPGTVPAGYSTNFAVKAVYSDASEQDVTNLATWAVGDSSVVLLDGTTTGLLRALKVGASSVSATFGGKTATTDVTVSIATLQGLVIDPATVSLGAGEKKRVVAKGYFSDSSELDLTSAAVWTSDAPSIAAVASSVGQIATQVEGLAPGAATITASVYLAGTGTAAATATSAVTVTAAPLASITVLPVSGNVTAGSTLQLSATATDSLGAQTNVTTTATWQVADTGVATIDANGLVTAVAAGQTTVTATKSGVTSNVVSLNVNALILPPNAPTGFSATAVSGSQINLAWTDTANETGYELDWSANGSTGWTAVSTPAQNATAASHTGLAATTQYFYRLRAVNSGGNSAYATANATTLQAPPPNVTSLTATADSQSQVTLNWTSGGGSTASYQIAYQATSAPANCATGTTSTSGTNSKVITGLTGGTQYGFRVCAVNGNAAPDVSSGTTVVKTPAASPPNVTSLTATADSATQVTLNWTSGGGSTASYKVAYVTGGSAPANCNTGTTSTSATNSKVITSLTGGTQYSFLVCALNDNGTPEMSSGTSVSKTPAASPPNVTGLTATADTASQITLNWTSGGGSTASYKIAYVTGGSAPANCNTGTTSASATNSKVITSLTGGQQYSFLVCALNDNGTPEMSSGTAVTKTPDAAPPNVTGLSPTVDSGTQVTLNWTSGGGSTATYKIAYVTGGSAPANCNTGTTSTSGTNSKVVTGLTASTQYSFLVCALNANGTPEMSSGTSTTATTNGTVATPTFSPVAGTYSSAQNVTISSTTGGSTFYYTTNGSTPTTASTLYSGPVNIAATSTLKALGVKSGWTDSAVGQAAYVIEQSDVFDSGSGNYTVPAGVYFLTIEIWGAGGGGGEGDGGGGGDTGGAGGGGGGYTIKSNLAVTPGQVLSYVVGSGGAGETSGMCNNGANGGNSNVAATYVANGGTGGTSCGTVPASTGGSASGGIVNLSGSGGAASTGYGSHGSPGGAGANGGAGGAEVSSDDEGNVGTAPGGGGGGGGKRASGGNGANGRVKFSYVVDQAINLVQSTSALTTTASGVTQTVTATWPSATHKGNLLVAVVNSRAIGTEAVPVITPPAGGWTLASSGSVNLGDNTGRGITSIYYIANAPSQSGNSVWTTTGGSGGVGHAQVALLEYSGIAFTSPLDVTANSSAATSGGGSPYTNDTTALSGTTAATSQATELAVAGLYAGYQQKLASNGFVPAQAASLGFNVYDKVLTSAGTQSTGSAFGSTPFAYTGAIATFKAYDTTSPMTFVVANSVTQVSVGNMICTGDFTNLDNAQWGSDSGAVATSDSCLSSDSDSWYSLNFKDFASTRRVPNTATIDGIEVRCRVANNGDGSQPSAYHVEMLKAGSLVGTPKSSLFTQNTLALTTALGGSTDLWGTTWTSAEVNDVGFGFQFRAAPNGYEDRMTVDYCQIKVWFH